jgi:DNA mismatch repair ATPase MutS
MVPFLCAIFSRFHEQKDIWTRAVSCLTEIDCLASLAITSGQQSFTMTRPEIIPYDDEEKPILELKSMIHPCVKMPAGKAFIPNDIFISPADD